MSFAANPSAPFYVVDGPGPNPVHVRITEKMTGHGTDEGTSPATSGIANAEPVRQKWYQWFSPTDSPEERRLILKLDGLILAYLWISYWVKTLDSATMSAAYVSGMKEELGLWGNELNYLDTCYL